MSNIIRRKRKTRPATAALAAMLTFIIGMSPQIGMGNAPQNTMPQEDKEQIYDNTSTKDEKATPAPPTAYEFAAKPLLGDVFSQDGTDAITIDDEKRAAITAAVSDIESRGNACGFVIVDLSDGSGISYNAEWECYCASTAKGLMACYLLDDVYISGKIATEDRSYLSEAIIDSDNNAYSTLSSKYADDAFVSWLSKLGIKHDLSDSNGAAYPYASAKSMASAWILFDKLLLKKTEAATDVSDMLSETCLSFIRNGIGEYGWTVKNKAGWIGEGSGSVNSTSDAAIIEKGDKRYILAIMSSEPDSETSEEHTAALAKSIVLAIAGDELFNAEIASEDTSKDASSNKSDDASDDENASKDLSQKRLYEGEIRA